MIRPDDGEQATTQSVESRGRQLLRAHSALVVLLVVGAAVRVAVMVAYPPAFGYFMDTWAYMEAAKFMAPSNIWPFGYSLFLKPFSYTRDVATVAAAQHLLGLVMGVGIYALLARRGLPRKWCALAAAPVLLDARQIILEHHVLSETLFTALMLGGLILLLWRARPTTWMCALSGLAFAGSALTRGTGQPLAGVVLVYLVVRRVGWRRVAAFTVTLVLPIIAYMAWYHQNHGVYALNEMTGRYMWQRTTTFVDCSKNGFTADELKICPVEPIGQREVSDLYLFALDRHRLSNQFAGVKNDRIFAGFARKAILGQPGDFVKTILRDGVHLVQPGWQAPQRIECTTDFWSMVSGPRATTLSGCKPAIMAPDFRSTNASYAAPTVTPLNSSLWAYGQTFVVSPLALMLMGLFAVVTACWRPRKVRPRDAVDAVLLSVLALTIVLLSLALSVIDLRFTVPLLTILPPAAVLAWHRLRGAPVPADEESQQVRAAG